MRTKNLLLFFFGVCLLILSAVQSCKKPNEVVPENPYNSIHRDTTHNEIPLDSLTITYIHKKILSTRCALPGCHVGNFEPDFRTPQSSFSTLVYAAVKKNNATNDYKYRVVPYDTTKSVLYQRITNCCFVNTNDRMPQDNIEVPLPDSSINLIAQWIMHGARDMFGHVAQLPNQEPVYASYAAINSTYNIVYSTNRLDSINYNPFVLADSISSFYFYIQIADDSTPQSNLLYNTLKISLKEDDFSAANSYYGFYLNAGANSGWLVSVLASSLPTNDTLFMRYYVNDGSHTNNTEFPRNESAFYYKYYWSFIRKP